MSEENEGIDVQDEEAETREGWLRQPYTRKVLKDLVTLRGEKRNELVLAGQRSSDPRIAALATECVRLDAMVLVFGGTPLTVSRKSREAGNA